MYESTVFQRKFRVDTTLNFKSVEKGPYATNKVIKLCWRLEINVNSLEELQVELQFKVKVKMSMYFYGK